MTTLIELHDHSIRVSSPDGLLLESPGFASTANNSPIYGTEALKLNRLHPQQNFNQFWFQLSMDPLVHKNKHFRHQADLAYGHLNALTQELNLGGDIVFAVPSHYSGNQLATLLGLTRHCAFNASGLVDMSLLALASLQEQQHAIFMDVQLHQTVLTRVVREQGEIIREKVISVPATGLVTLNECWANTITDAFIKQSRFDPQHNADTEQYLFNELQNWLKSVSENQELLLEFNNKGTVHQASLTLKNFEQRAQAIYKRVIQELHSLAEPSTPVYALERVASLPGLKQALPELVTVADDMISLNAFQHLDKIKSNSDALKLVARLPLLKQPQQTGKKTTAKVGPSHFLYKHKAYALPELNLPELNLPAPIKISLQAEGYYLHNDSRLDLQLNGTPVTEPAMLKLGDCLTVNENSTIEFIQVH